MSDRWVGCTRAIACCYASCPIPRAAVNDGLRSSSIRTCRDAPRHLTRCPCRASNRCGGVPLFGEEFLRGMAEIVSCHPEKGCSFHDLRRSAVRNTVRRSFAARDDATTNLSPLRHRERDRPPRGRRKCDRLPPQQPSAVSEPFSPDAGDDEPRSARQQRADFRMPGPGLEPGRGYPHGVLSPVCLPIPPPRPAQPARVAIPPA